MISLQHCVLGDVKQELDKIVATAQTQASEKGVP